MLRKKMRPISAALIVCCVVGIAFAGAVKLNLVPVTDSPDPNASGRAVLNYAKCADKTIIQVNCWGLTPGDEYGVNLANGMGGISDPVIAKKNGTITMHGEQEGDQSGNIVRVRNRTVGHLALQSE